ncbi:hypothetical protein [Desmonostoc muscorum]|nr:hypothetical protein [Desmonostoc muscorum]
MYKLVDYPSRLDGIKPVSSFTRAIAVAFLGILKWCLLRGCL